MCMRRAAATPPQGEHVIFPLRRSEDPSVCHLWLIIFSSLAELEGAWHYITSALVSSSLLCPELQPCHLVVRLTEIISHEKMCGCRSFLFSRCPVCVLCISSLCSQACKSKHWTLSCPSTPHTHNITRSVRTSTDTAWACKVRLCITAAAQRNAKTTTTQGQSSYHRVCSQFRPCRPSLNPGWQLHLHFLRFAVFFQSPNLTIKSVFPCEVKKVFHWALM